MAMTAAPVRGFIGWSGVRIGLTARLLLLVIFAVVPALVILAWNEYDLRLAREADIRQQVVQTTKEFGEEIGEIREGARQFLLALAQLNTVKYQSNWVLQRTLLENEVEICQL